MFYQPTLGDFARRYVESRDLSALYQANLIRRAKALEDFAGTGVISLALCETAVNGFLASIAAAGRSPRTVKGYRGDLLSLWNAAADDGLADYPRTRRIRRPRLEPLLVECYSLDEARELIAAADLMAGSYARGVPRRLYWAATIRLAWDTGLRRGDVWEFRRDAVRPDRSVRIVQHKTRRIVRGRLHESTLAALDRIDRPKPCGWPHSGWTFGAHFRELVEAAGVNRGTFKWLRRSSGSYIDCETPGAGYRHLGHADPGTFARHYDAQLAAADLPQPPEL